MIYTAPRQLLFAIILVASFCLHTLILVLSTEHQIAESRVQKGERMVTQLINESALALTYADRVSLSVIANRYTSEYDVTRLVIKDVDEEILVQTGDAPLQQGKTIEEMATRNDSVIGSVALTMKATSMGEIVTMLWQFILSSFVIHFLIWLIYCQFARPTKEQLESLSREIYAHYFAQSRNGEPKPAQQTQKQTTHDPVAEPIKTTDTDNNQPVNDLPKRVTKKQNLKSKYLKNKRSNNQDTKDPAKKHLFSGLSTLIDNIDKNKPRFLGGKTTNHQTTTMDTMDAEETADNLSGSHESIDSKTIDSKKGIENSNNANFATDAIDTANTTTTSDTSDTFKTSDSWDGLSDSDLNLDTGVGMASELNQSIYDTATSDELNNDITTSIPRQKYTPATDHGTESNSPATDSPQLIATDSQYQPSVTHQPVDITSLPQQESDTQAEDEQTKLETTTSKKKHSIGSELSAFISGQQSAEKKSLFKIQSKPQDATTTSEGVEQSLSTDATTTTEPANTDNPASSAPHPLLLAETVQIQINFVDKFHLLDKLSDVVAEPYFELCTQLLNQAIVELLKLPMLQGVFLANSPSFSYDGAIVELQASTPATDIQEVAKDATENNHTDSDTTPQSHSEQAKPQDAQQHQSKHYGHLTLAGVMLGILYNMLNEIVYDKHRELGKFAFAVSVGVSQAGREKAMNKLLTGQAKDHQVMMLLAKPETEYVQQHIRLRRITKPTNVSERECASVRGMNKQMTEQLTQVRNAVLMVEQ